MEKEQSYSRFVGPEHLHRYGQYFTPPAAAEFMAGWACPGAEKVLDPAAGNSIFLTAARRAEPSCTLTGYELDPRILAYFGNPAGAELRAADYLTGDWSERYDAIVCNPPYSRFQGVENRAELLEEIFRHTGVRYSRYTNLCILFLLKSLSQLSCRGRLAYLIPSEFLNSRYGEPVKALLVEQKLLRAVIRLARDGELFPNAVTTCCILLADREEKDSAVFYNVDRPEQLALPLTGGREISYTQLKPEDKWRGFFTGEEACRGGSLRPLGEFCTVSRGIATGANSFYCLNRETVLRYGLEEGELTPCICRSSQVPGPVFRRRDFERLAGENRPVYLLDVKGRPSRGLEAYLSTGRAAGVDKKYLPSRRKPWYSMEQKETAPIWVSSACRGPIRFVRNLAGVKQLTTFHGLYVKEGVDPDLLFCTLLAPSVQKLLLANRKELGGGLQKFQPGDLNSALTVDLEALTPADRAALLREYRQLTAGPVPGWAERLDEILAPYLD